MDTARMMVAYFESEAARPQLAPTDYAAAIAMDKIPEDGGAAWRFYLDGAPPYVHDAVTQAYIERNTAAAAAKETKRALAQTTYDREKARGGKNAHRRAIRAAREILSDFDARREEIVRFEA